MLEYPAAVQFAENLARLKEEAKAEGPDSCPGLHGYREDPILGRSRTDRQDGGGDLPALGLAGGEVAHGAERGEHDEQRGGRGAADRAP